jgi:hypothetical protein
VLKGNFLAVLIADLVSATVFGAIERSICAFDEVRECFVLSMPRNSDRCGDFLDDYNTLVVRDGFALERATDARERTVNAPLRGGWEARLRILPHPNEKYGRHHVLF